MQFPQIAHLIPLRGSGLARAVLDVEIRNRRYRDCQGGCDNLYYLIGPDSEQTTSESGRVKGMEKTIIGLADALKCRVTKRLSALIDQPNYSR